MTEVHKAVMGEMGGDAAPEGDQPLAVVKRYIWGLNHVFDEPPPFNPFDMYDQDITYILTGQFPMGDTYTSYEDFKTRLVPMAGPNLKAKPGAHTGFIPLEYIVEGNTVVVHCRSRTSNAHGVPYNNTYFVWYEIENGKIKWYLEDLDSSLAWQRAFDMRLDEEKG